MWSNSSAIHMLYKLKVSHKASRVIVRLDSAIKTENFAKIQFLISTSPIEPMLHMNSLKKVWIL